MISRNPSSRATTRLVDDSGAALVEFALVMPFLLLVIVGLLEFGRALNYWIDQTHLANVAARWAAVDKNPGPGSSLHESVRLQANTEELRTGGTASVPLPLQVCFDFPAGTSAIGDPVEATVSTEFNWLPFLGEEIGVATTTLRGSATMRLERPPTQYSAECA